MEWKIKFLAAYFLGRILIILSQANDLTSPESYAQSLALKKNQLKLLSLHANNSAAVRRRKGNQSPKRLSKAQIASNQLRNIIVGVDIYNRWWTGHDIQSTFRRSKWSKSINGSSDAVFSILFSHTGIQKAKIDLFLGSMRKFYSQDVVVAIPNQEVQHVKGDLVKYNVSVFEISSEICNLGATVLCGTEDERVSIDLFRFYFFEIWSSFYSTNSKILLIDFDDAIFQSNPFNSMVGNVMPSDDHFRVQLFEEYHPNSVIRRQPVYRDVLIECYDEAVLNLLGSKVVLSKKAILGSRNGILIFAHHLTSELQEAPGRFSDGRCFGPGIDLAFTHALHYSNRLRHLLNIQVIPQGEGAVNVIGRLYRPLLNASASSSSPRWTVEESLEYWNILDDRGYILNWDGSVSPVIVGTAAFLTQHHTHGSTGVASAAPCNAVLTSNCSLLHRLAVGRALDQGRCLDGEMVLR